MNSLYHDVEFLFIYLQSTVTCFHEKDKKTHAMRDRFIAFTFFRRL